MWYCEDCDIEITKNKKNRHLKTARHQKNIGNNPYHHSKIYKIICNDTGKIYVGSTTRNRIEERLIEHKCDKKQYNQGKSYSHICASYQLLDNCRIELIEEYKCENLDELRIREQYHIENNECVNFIRAKGIGQKAQLKEWREKNKEKVKARKSLYYEKNKEYISEKKKEYREKNKEYISEKNKEWREKNKEKVKAQRKLYRENNKEKINTQKGRKVICDCGVSHTHDHTARHKRSKHHINYMEQQI